MHNLIDTHCHIHDQAYPLDADEVYDSALEAGLSSLICVGTSIQNSIDAIKFAESHSRAFAAIGVHPHDAKDTDGSLDELIGTSEKLVAVGEIGLDYFYEYSDRKRQIQVLERQLQSAVDHSLPVIFHVRDAFDDFWPILDNFRGIKGVLHSFTDTQKNADEGLKRGLLLGINGISTFTKDSKQQDMYYNLPLDKIVLETDAPFLTPSPFRGKVNVPSMVVEIARFHADKRGVSIDSIAAHTTANATNLFQL